MRLIAFLAAAALLAFQPLHAADSYTEGSDYELILPAQPGAGNGKVQVVELFWYGCPHCFQFEPVLKEWLKKRPDYVEFVRVPAVFKKNHWHLHAKAFYAAEMLGVAERMHEALFRAIHERNQPLRSEDELADLFAAQGVAKEQFKAAFNSFGVETKANRAMELTQRYGIDGVPSMVVNGKYRIDGGMAKSYENLVLIADYLARRERGVK